MRFKIPHTRYSLAARLSASTGVTIIVCFASVTAMISAILYFTSIRQIRTEYSSAAEFIAAVSAQPILSGDSSNIDAAIRTFVKNPNIASVSVVAGNGRVLSAYERTGGQTSSRTLKTSSPVRSESGTVLGKVVVEVSLENFHRRLMSAFVLIALLMLLPAVAGIIILRRRIAALISMPLQQFLCAAKSLSRGDPSRRIDIQCDNEIGLLAQEFNRIMDDLHRDQEHRIASQKFETIGALAGGIAHDFNNILGGIIGNVSLLRYKIGNGSASREETERYLQTVEAISQKAVSLSKQLISLSKPRESSNTPVNLETVISNVAEICRNTLDRSIEITSRPLPKNAMTSGDPSQIEQALLNVCINAAHSMTIMRSDGEARGGKLVLSLYGPVFPTGDTSQFSCNAEIPYWAVSVTDEGVGMESPDIARVYDPFFTTKNGQGSGLGMTMVYSIINRHSGFIAIESQKGKGTSVTLHLPEHRVEAEPAVTPAKKGFIPKTNGIILLVDDEDYILQMATSILSFGGYQSVKASSGSDAVNIFIERQNEISLVVLDLLMPGKSGLETYNEILSINPSVRVLFTSGLRSSEGNIVTKIPRNAAFLPKPYTAEQLLSIVDRLVTADNHSVF